MPLPPDVSTASPLNRPGTNPIQTLVRNGFRRNRHDTSPRLVVSALKNGYRYLTLFARAADPDAPEHGPVLAFLRENQARLLALRAEREAAKAFRVSTAPIEGRTPLLKKVSAEGEPPAYEPSGPPRPLEGFRSGVRKPPTLGHVGGVPFLRLQKPQPRFLERVLRQKSVRRAERVEKILAMEGPGMEDALDEDEWEGIVEWMLDPETEVGERVEEVIWRRKKGEVTYQETLKDAIARLIDVSEKERLDLVARGQAMWKMVLAEQELALKEEKKRLEREGRGGEEPQLRDWRRPVYKRDRKTPSSGRKQEQGSRVEERGKPSEQSEGANTPEQGKP